MDDLSPPQDGAGKQALRAGVKRPRVPSPVKAVVGADAALPFLRDDGARARFVAAGGSPLHLAWPSRARARRDLAPLFYR